MIFLQNLIIQFQKINSLFCGKPLKPEERATKYKQTAKALFKLNEELDKELLGTQD